MEWVYSILVGLLFAISVYLFLQPSMIRILFAIIIFSSAINLLIFLLGRMDYSRPAFIGTGDTATFANPLPHALILTAIVIGFGLIAYCFILVRCLWQQNITLNVDKEEPES